MPLITEGIEIKGSSEWKFLGGHNMECPICRKSLSSNDQNIEYTKTRRGSHLFIHTECMKGGKNNG